MSFVAEEEALHEAARTATGLDDFGDDTYLAGLRALLGSLDEDARLTPLGELAVRGMIVEALAGRLHSEAGFARMDEPDAAAVRAPLVILGLPRTGTTALHRLLARDPRLQSLELWLATTPKPRPRREAWPDDPEFRACDDRMRGLYERSPEMKAIHWMAADLPDECWHLLAQNFAHSSWQANAHVPGYARWWAAHDMRPAYHRHRRNLALIGSAEPERRWLLKDATHLFDLGAFLDVYPDACLVQTHRDPVPAIASVCSLCWAARGPIDRAQDRRAFGRATLELWERAVLGALAVRRERGEGNFHDVPFEAFAADPLGAARGIQERFGLAPDAASEAALAAWQAAHPRGEHGAHRYDLADWGLEAGEIRERFRPYTEAFDIRPTP